MNGRPPDPEPDAAWATVCFPGARPGRPPRHTDRDDGRSSSVLWRSRAAQGLALVRLDPLPAATPATPTPASTPASTRGHGHPHPCDVHLWVDADSPGRVPLREHADVLLSRVPLPPVPAYRRVRDLLAGHPGCLAAAVSDTVTRCVVGIRDGTGAVLFVRPHRGPAGAPVPLHVLVSVVHAWAVSGRSPRALRSVARLPRH